MRIIKRTSEKWNTDLTDETDRTDIKIRFDPLNPFNQCSITWLRN